MKHARLVVRSLIAVAIVATSLVLLPGGAAQAASCHAASCGGKDPSATGCANDAYTPVQAVKAGNMVIELRYSPTCRAAWARITIADPGDVAHVYSSAGPDHARTVTSGHDTYTLMVNDANIQARACGRNVSYSPDKTNCTGWF